MAYFRYFQSFRNVLISSQLFSVCACAAYKYIYIYNSIRLCCLQVKKFVSVYLAFSINSMCHSNKDNFVTTHCVCISYTYFHTSPTSLRYNVTTS